MLLRVYPKFVDEYGNFKSYGELPVEEFVTSKEHKYVGRFIQSKIIELW